MLQNKWKLFRPVLRSHAESPAQKVMNNYFEKLSLKKFRWRPVMKFPNLLHNDMTMLQKDEKFIIDTT